MRRRQIAEQRRQQALIETQAPLPTPVAAKPSATVIRTDGLPRIVIKPPEPPKKTGKTRAAERQRNWRQTHPRIDYYPSTDARVVIESLRANGPDASVSEIINSIILEWGASGNGTQTREGRRRDRLRSQDRKAIVRRRYQAPSRDG